MGRRNIRKFIYFEIEYENMELFKEKKEEIITIKPKWENNQTQESIRKSNSAQLNINDLPLKQQETINQLSNLKKNGAISEIYIEFNKENGIANVWANPSGKIKPRSGNIAQSQMLNTVETNIHSEEIVKYNELVKSGNINGKKPTSSSYFTLNDDGALKENQLGITQRTENWFKNFVR